MTTALVTGGAGFIGSHLVFGPRQEPDSPYAPISRCGLDPVSAREILRYNQC
jgi:hypothetical protein